MKSKNHVGENFKSLTPIEMEEEKSKPYSLFEQVIVSKIICFYLNGEIGDAGEYAEMIHRIRTSTENDVIEIHLNTPGGDLDTGVQLINAIKSSAAYVITVIDSRAHSLGTLLFLSGDEQLVHDNCTMMFHNFSSGTYGKGNEQQAELDTIIKWFNKLIRKVCHPFLDSEEIGRILKGEDIWMDTDEIRRRLKRMVSEEKQPKSKKTKQLTEQANVKEDKPDETSGKLQT